MGENTTEDAVERMRELRNEKRDLYDRMGEVG